MPVITTIKVRRGTTAAWAAVDPVLAVGELGLETDTGVVRFGDGVTPFTELPSLLFGSGAASLIGATAIPGLAGANVQDMLESAQANIDEVDLLKVDKAMLDANSVLAAVVDNTPVALLVPASRVVGRKSSGDVTVLTGAEIADLIPSGTYADNPTPGTPKTAITTGNDDQEKAGALTMAGRLQVKSGTPWIDPRSFGAPANGADPDDTAFAAMLTALGTRGRGRITPGTYRLETPLTVPKGVHWDQDPAADILWAGDNVTALTIDGGTIAHDGRDGHEALIRLRRASPYPWTTTDTTSVGVKFRNVNHSRYRVEEVIGFETGVLVEGDAYGVVGNEFSLGYLVNNKRGLVLSQINGGWTNQNLFKIGSIRIDSGHPTAGTRWVMTGLDNCNQFFNMNLEGGTVNVEKAVECGGKWDIWFNCRWEGLGVDQAVFLPTSQFCLVLWGFGNFGRAKPFLDQGSQNVFWGSRGHEAYTDGGTFGAPAAYTARSLTSANDKAFRALDINAAECWLVDGGGRVKVFRPGEAHPRVETKQYAGDGPAAIGGIHFGLGSAATDLSIGRTSATQPGFTTSAPWVPKLATQTLAANGTLTINTATGDTHRVTLGANATAMALTNPVASGQRLRIELIQDATGGRTVVWATNIAWEANTAPTVTATANRRTIVDLEYDSAVTKWVEVARKLDVAA